MIDLTRHLRPGDTVLIGQGCAEPRSLVEALVAQRHELRDVTLFVGGSYTGLLAPELADAFTFVGFGGVGETAKLSRAGLLRVLPVHLGSIPGLVRSGRLRVDVAMVQVTPADATGTHSLGLVADYLQVAVDAARVVLAEVNPHVPWTEGDTAVRAERITEAVVDERPLITLRHRGPTAADEAIADHLADLIPDGATIQLGIGATPDAVLARLRHRRDLGIHSGLMSDALLDLVESGAVTNARKERDRGVTVAGAVYGTERLYRWADRNPALRVRSVAYTHDVAVLASFGAFFAVNSAIEVDLTGQINAETMGGEHAGLVGGQGAFARAGLLSERGRSIIALQSVARGGEVSRIVPVLPDGIVSTPRADADLIVTEHGVADLRGASLDERRRRMLAVADPRHRDALARHGA